MNQIKDTASSEKMSGFFARLKRVAINVIRVLFIRQDFAQEILPLFEKLIPYVTSTFHEAIKLITLHDF